MFADGTVWTAMLAHWQIRATLLLLLAISHKSTAQDSGANSSVPTFRSSVSEVRVTFFASDGNSQPVENLTKADFAVVDNDLVVRNFRSFARSDETSLDVVALVDVCLLYTSPSPRDRTRSRMPSSA